MTNQKIIQSIPQNQFRTKVLTKKSPYAHLFYKEIAWYEAIDIDLLAMIAIDKIDNDYCAMIFENNGRNQYQPLDNKTGIRTRTNAKNYIRNYIKSEIISHDSKNKQKESSGIDLFTICVPESKLNPAFLRLLNWRAYSPAKELLIAITDDFEDKDGNFVKEFQTHGFDARIWELYLFCYLKEENFKLQDLGSRPDYFIKKYEKELCIEAVTVGRKEKRTKGNIFLNNRNRMDSLNATDYSMDKMALRFGSPLYTKLQKKYHELDNVQGKPLIIAIADFYEDFSMTYTFNAVVNYLYGYKHSPIYDSNGNLIVVPKEIEGHEKGDKLIPSGFFFQENAENISGVLFSNLGTISKFNRIGLGSGYGEKDIVINQVGMKYKYDLNAIYPKHFQRLITYGSGDESWSEGMSLFHNPNAKHPIPKHLFEKTTQHSFKEGEIVSYILEPHPYFSYNYTFSLKGEVR